MMVDAESNARGGHIDFGQVAEVACTTPSPSVLVVCEHASNRIPDGLHSLSVSPEVQRSHVAWDPGALGVARALSQRLPSVLVHCTVSRLVYDCNRPPDAPSAIPERSERYDIPGNRGLSAGGRAQRVDGVFRPFSDALAHQIKAHRASLQAMVTVHSFTPVYDGVARAVDLGILHGQDARLAHAMMDQPPHGVPYDIRLNAPYGPSDGVAHTLDTHGTGNGLRNVMIEIRNDLIATAEAQEAMGALLAGWIEAVLASEAGA